MEKPDLLPQVMILQLAKPATVNKVYKHISSYMYMFWFWTRDDTKVHAEIVCMHGWGGT